MHRELEMGRFLHTSWDYRHLNNKTLFIPLLHRGNKLFTSDNKFWFLVFDTIWKAQACERKSRILQVRDVGFLTVLMGSMALDTPPYMSCFESYSLRIGNNRSCLPHLLQWGYVGNSTLMEKERDLGSQWPWVRDFLLLIRYSSTSDQTLCPLALPSL